MSIKQISAKWAAKREYDRQVREFARALEDAPTPASRHELEILARR
jgi:hypothetical protein